MHLFVCMHILLCISVCGYGICICIHVKIFIHKICNIFFLQTKQLILRQQSEIVSLQARLSSYDDNYKCKIAELNNKILHHTHNRSVINLNHNRPAYSCDGGESDLR